MENIFGWTVEELRENLSAWKLPAYRAKQIAEWLYRGGAGSFDEMTNLPKTLREALSQNFQVERPTLKARLDSSDGCTSKFLLEFADGVAVESVLMRQSYGNSVCVSTQAGCRMGCIFCASTLHGLMRNLTRGEIFSQLLYMDELLRKEGQKVDTVIIMGSGEPLENYEAVLGFIRLAHQEYALNLGYRNFTLSTSGLVPEIYRLAQEEIPINLSISLHAPEQELRSKLMPINRKYPLADLIKAGAAYGEKTKRRVTYEYILIAGSNDNEEQAKQLAGILRRQLAAVNLIPVNPVEERGLFRPSDANILVFEKILAEHKISVTVRKEMGVDIAAACGQLRNRHLSDATVFSNEV